MTVEPRAAAARYLAGRDLLEHPLADVWLDTIAAHLEPLPANRLWRLRAGRRTVRPVGEVAAHVTRRLQPPAGTRPQPVCDPWCLEQHARDDLDGAA